jgi:hypothetical protein
MKTIVLLLLLAPLSLNAMIFIPMDDAQPNHLKAYGLAYLALKKGVQVKWLLNYRGGSFILMSDSAELAEWGLLRNVANKPIGEADFASIKAVIDKENMNIVDLDKAPVVAVYAPPWTAPWDDAVTLVLEYAEIPYTRIWDQEVIGGLLTPENFDWLHLHHEDFTGQYGKFWFNYGAEKWYIEQVALFQKIAASLGFKSVQEEKKAVAAKIRQYVIDGGFMFAMCSATDTLDIALACQGFDIVPGQIDGTPFDSAWPQKIDYQSTLAFEKFQLITEPYIYEFSDIDIDPTVENIYAIPFYFRLNDFSAKYDVIPTMLIQDHKNLVKGFLGQTTGFQKNLIKKDITILAGIDGKSWVNYIHGDRGKGTFTFYAGHDPEDYAHQVGDPPTNLDLFPNSPGYRLILNNILFPAAKTKKKKT